MNRTITVVALVCAMSLPAFAQTLTGETQMATDASHDAALYTQDRAARATPWDHAAFGRTFRHEIAIVNGGVRIHYVIGGEGSPVVLLHGFPQHWREWRLVMPTLAEAGYTVVAPDLRGFGESDKPLDGYDVVTVAEDIRQLLRQLGLESVRLVGHDVGASVAYACAAAHPAEVQGLALIEAFPAGLEPRLGAVPMLKDKPTWHLGFLSTPDLPETLLANRERALLAFFFREGAYDQTAFSDEDIQAYVRPFAASGGTRAALAHIRAIPQSASQNRGLSQRKLPMPVLAIGAAPSFGASMAEAARQFAENVTGVVVERSGHWIPEERPVWLGRQLITFFGQNR
jgi:pimeloyl-ACP methyl ester carboxylesterase